MKLEHTMKVGDDDFTVKYSCFGSEKYYLNGKLIEKHWSFRFSGQREFDIKGNKVVIKVSVKPKNYYSQAFLNDELYVEELFPDFKAFLEQQNQPSSWVERVLLILGGVLISAALILYFFR